MLLDQSLTGGWRSLSVEVVDQIDQISEVGNAVAVNVGGFCRRGRGAVAVEVGHQENYIAHVYEAVSVGISSHEA